MAQAYGLLTTRGGTGAVSRHRVFFTDDVVQGAAG